MGDLKLVHNIEYGAENIFGNYKVRIEPDEDPESPREWDNIGTMVCWHNRYNLGDKKGVDELVSHLNRSPKADAEWDIHKTSSPGEFHEWAEACGFIMLPLYLYDHSGLTMSTGKFSCPWDSGQVGWIFATPEQIADTFPGMAEDEARETTRKILLSEVEFYDQYLRGDIYGFIIEDLRGNVVDSCWGFYGWDEAAQAADGELCGLEDSAPDTILTELEEQMFKYIVGLRVDLADADENMASSSHEAEAAKAANHLGITYTWKD
jgi:hypothetical protein